VRPASTKNAAKVASKPTRTRSVGDFLPRRNRHLPYRDAFIPNAAWIVFQFIPQGKTIPYEPPDS